MRHKESLHFRAYGNGCLDCNQVRGVWNYDNFCTGNRFCQRRSSGRRGARISVTHQDEGGTRDLLESIMRFKSSNHFPYGSMNGRIVSQ